MIIGHTSGGSPIFSPSETKPKYRNKGKTLYRCSADERHKLTKNQARSSNYFCTHCGAALRVRAQILAQIATFITKEK